MGLFDGLAEVLHPHATKLNDTISLHGANISNKLDRIASAKGDQERGDVGDNWHRVNFKHTFSGEEEQELASPKKNEIYLIQSIVADGIFNKSPAFLILADGAMIASGIKEAVGAENFGGDAVILPGETAVVLARAAGTISLTMTVIRRKLPVVPRVARQFDNPSSDRITPVNTHDPARDIIESRTGQYVEHPPESASEGRTDPGNILDPTSA